jgi:hypothetical protein
MPYHHAQRFFLLSQLFNQLRQKAALKVVLPTIWPDIAEF